MSIGKSGSGKTTLIWKLFTERKARFKFIYDHKAMEFSRRYKIKPCFTLQDMMEIIKQGQGTICFVPMKMFPGQSELGFEVFCNFVFSVSEHIAGVKLLLVDELQNVVGSYARPKPLLIVCDTGRTFQIDCYFIAAASNAIHNLVRKQVTELYCFNNAGDIVWETGTCGFDEQQIRTLRKGEWLHRNLDIGSDILPGGNSFK
jgi:hypothetical protein